MTQNTLNMIEIRFMSVALGIRSDVLCLAQSGSGNAGASKTLKEVHFNLNSKNMFHCPVHILVVLLFKTQSTTAQTLHNQRSATALIMLCTVLSLIGKIIKRSI